VDEQDNIISFERAPQQDGPAPSQQPPYIPPMSVARIAEATRHAFIAYTTLVNECNCPGDVAVQLTAAVLRSEPLMAKVFT
jgi:hypothetical protein